MNFKYKMTKEQKEELKSKVMDKGDPLAVQRCQGILLIEEGASSSLLKTITGYKREVVVKLRRLYIKFGIEALLSKKRKKSPKAMLTKTQKIQIVEILNNKKPTDFGFDYEFWTASILGFLIGEQYGVKYKSKTSIYLIFKQAKFTFHKPEKKSEKHDEKVINEWKKHYEGIIKEECNRQDTIVLAGDEAVLTSTTRLQRVWLPNEYPAFVQDTTKRETVHLYGFLNVQSGVAVAFKTEAQTGELTVAVLKKLARLYPNKRIVIFWDNASWHKCAVVRQFLTETKQFKLYNFPPYAPELNPQEHVWKEMRDNVLSNVFIKNMKVAVDKAIQYIDNTIFKYKFFGLHGTSNV